MLTKVASSQAQAPKHQILLCGTQYGSSYIQALFQSRHLDLVAILARGSRRSITLAEQAAVPLYTAVEQIACKPSAAIVALGGELGFEVANQLLLRNIPVLLEHPVTPEHLGPLLELSKTQGTSLHINSHFSELPASLEFITVCQKLNQISRPLVINMSCNSRTLFSALDMVLRAFDGDEVGEIAITNFGEHYRLIQFSIGGVLCLITYQCWRHELDDSTDAPLGHQLSVTYPEGVACLTGTFGPFYWYPLLAAANRATPAYSNCYESERKSAIAPVQEQIIHWRLQANICAIDRLIKASNDPQQGPRSQGNSYLMQLSTVWQTIFNLAGFQVVKAGCNKLDDRFMTAANILNT